MDEKQLQRAMNLIAVSGNARSEAVQAMHMADDANYQQASEMLVKAKKDLHEAHNVQTAWMSSEMNGETVEKTILLIHSQDHFIAADIMMTVASEYLVQSKRLHALEVKYNE